MRKRPVFLPACGRFLEELRVAKGWSLRQAASIARRQRLDPLNYQVLFRLEKGQTKKPSAATLKALADLYEVDYQDVVDRFTAESYSGGRTLPTAPAVRTIPDTRRVLQEAMDAIGPAIGRIIPLLVTARPDWLPLIEDIVNDANGDEVPPRNRISSASKKYRK